MDLIERMARLYNGTTAIHKLALHETQDPRDSGSAVPAFHWCVREREQETVREREKGSCDGITHSNHTLSETMTYKKYSFLNALCDTC